MEDDDYGSLLSKATRVYATTIPNPDNLDNQKQWLDEAIRGIKTSVNAFGLNENRRGSLTREEIEILVDARAILKRLQKNIENDSKFQNEKYGL